MRDQTLQEVDAHVVRVVAVWALVLIVGAGLGAVGIWWVLTR